MKTLARFNVFSLFVVFFLFCTGCYTKLESTHETKINPPAYDDGPIVIYVDEEDTSTNNQVQTGSVSLLIDSQFYIPKVGFWFYYPLRHHWYRDWWNPYSYFDPWNYPQYPYRYDPWSYPHQHHWYWYWHPRPWFNWHHPYGGYQNPWKSVPPKKEVTQPNIKRDWGSTRDRKIRDQNQVRPRGPEIRKSNPRIPERRKETPQVTPKKRDTNKPQVTPRGETSKPRENTNARESDSKREPRSERKR